MRFLLLLAVAACTETVDPAANLCPGAVRIDECSARCKTGDPATAEVCAVDLEIECLDECIRCNPHDAWCPRD
jgi:hypothetical protein